MRTGPTSRMVRRADTHLVDVVELRARTETTATRSTMAAAGYTFGDPLTCRALVRDQTHTDQDTPTVNRQVRDLTVWLEQSAAVTAGMRCRFVTVDDDSSLVGEAGTVIDVERGSYRAVRRCTVRMGNDE